LQGFFSLRQFLFVPFSFAFSRLFWRTIGEQYGEHKLSIMGITISTKTSRNGLKKWYYFEWGKAADQRKAAGMFTWVKPKSQIEKNVKPR